MQLHGFLITAHKDPEQLLDILRLLESENHYFYINFDRKHPKHKEIANIITSKIKNVKFIHLEIAHGGYSQIDCTLRLLELAYKDEMDYFHLISGQDFPCRSTSEFDHFFESQNEKSFMHFDPDNLHSLWSQHKYPSRVYHWYFNDMKHRDIAVIDIMVKILNRISSNIYWRSHIEGIRAGWNWFSWHRKVVKFVLDEKKRNKKYFKRFRHTSCCDEVIFHTLLYPFIGNLNIEPNNSLRYINWGKNIVGRKQKNSPLILNEEEYDEIMNSNALFCRKIDSSISLQLKERLSRQIIPDFKLTETLQYE